MKTATATFFCATALLAFSGCNHEIIQTNEDKLLFGCINSSMYSQDQFVFLGPVSYDVGDVWEKSGSGNGAVYEPMFAYSTLVKDATAPQPQITIGQQTQCTSSQNNGTTAGVSLDANAKILTALPLSASAAAGLQNAKVEKVTFKSMEIDQIAFPQQYIDMYSSINSAKPERVNATGGGYYWAYAMVKVTDYTVTASYTSNNNIAVGASATLPAALSGNLGASVTVKRTSNNEYQYTIPGTVYIAAIMRPFGPGGTPQSSSGGYNPGTNVIYAGLVADRGK